MIRGLHFGGRKNFGLPATASCCFLTGCVALPELPGDRELPVREILQHTACELQDGFRSLTLPGYSKAKATRWLVAVKLTPKIDDEATLGFGRTWKSSGSSAAKLVTWVLGTAPGLQLDAKSEDFAIVSYNLKSSDLIDDNTLICDRNAGTYHTLARHLGIDSWLRRTVAAMDATQMATIDAPGFTADISIKFSGNGTYTYAFPLGNDLVSFGGNYIVDERLDITMTEIKQTYRVATLPGNSRSKVTASSISHAAAVEDAKARLDILQLQQSLSNLKVSPQ